MTNHAAIATFSLLVLIPLMAGCDVGNPAADGDPSPTQGVGMSSAAPAATRPATGPTSKGVRLPAFPPDGLYFSPTHTLRVATGGRPQVSALIDRHLPELTRGYKDPDIKGELLKLFDAEKVPFVGAAVLMEGPSGEEKGQFYFLGKRGLVHIDDGFVRKASAAAGGRNVQFDPMTYVTHFLYRASQSTDDAADDEAADKDVGARVAPRYSYMAMMTAGRFALAVRVGDRFSAPKVACLMFEDGDVSLLMDKVTAANLPATRPAATEMMP